MWRMVALINCYGSPVGRIAVSHRNTELPGTSREGSRVVSWQYF